ncbi:E3 SUMO-protein ligase ZBED1-like isoform X3 [Epinephelus moara]|nr:E3 SUMO-protein ligase ZBED1-like isoform X3 [Epinephelus moara]
MSEVEVICQRWRLSVRGDVSEVEVICQRWRLYVRGGGYLSEVEVMCQRWRLCVRGGGYVSEVEVICQRWRLSVRGGGYMSEVEVMCQRWRIYVRGGGYVSEVENICQRWRLCVRGGGYMSEVEVMCQRWRLYVRGGSWKQPALTQLSLASSLSRSTPYDKNSQKQKEITSAVTYDIAKDMAPVSVVEKPGFRKLINTLDPRFNLPSHKYFAEKALPELYIKVREELANQLTNVTHFSTTADIWSSRTCEPYLSLTVHYIDNWELKSKCLQTSFLPEDHTGGIIAQGLQDALMSWNLNEARQVCITTDNGANIVKAVSLNQWTCLQCFGHRLHLAIERSMKDTHIDHAVAVCKKVVSSFSFSWKRRRDLATAQQELNLPAHQLISESPTRWGSREKMIERVLKQEQVISQVLAADKKTRHLVLTWQDLEVLESVHKALKPLLKFTDALSGQSYVTVSYVKPVLHLFQSSLLAHQEDDTPLTQSIKASILDYLSEKYSDPSTNDLLDMAGLVDPRFKTTYCTEGKVEDIKSRALAEMEAMLSESDQGTAELAASHPQDATTASQPTEPLRKKTLGSFFKMAATSSSSTLSQRERIEKELSAYLQSVNVDSEANPLQWWNDHEEMFPNLKNVAKKYLCVPATSSPLERVFSTSGNIVTCQRASL